MTNQVRNQCDMQDAASAAQTMVIMVDRERRILDLTPSAEALLDDGIWLARAFGRLGVGRQRDMSRLDRALAEAAHAGESALGIGDGALVAEVVRMGGERQPPCFLILVREVKDQCNRKVADAARGYGLTQAEQRLLRVLFDGISLPEAARCLGVARTTARTHLQRLFEKTGTRRQADLLRIIALGHAAFLPG